MSDDRLLGWQLRTEWPLSLLAVSFLAAYAIPILDPALPAGTRTALGWWTWLI